MTTWLKRKRSSEEIASQAPRKIFLRIAVPFLGLYIFYVWRTPGLMLYGYDPPFSLLRIGIFLMWLVLLYYFRVRRNNRWTERYFVIGVLFGAPWISFVGLYMVITRLQNPEQISPLQLACISGGVFYGILSGLWSAQTETVREAVVGGFLFFLLQFVVDVILLGPFKYVT